MTGHTPLVKREGWWYFMETGNGVTRESLAAWYESGDWEIKAMPFDPKDPPERPPEPWAKEDEHSFQRFGAGADYRHSCAYCRYPRRHPIHGLEEGLERAPERFPMHNEPPNTYSVLRCYASLIDTLDEYNEMVSEEDRVMIPFTLQEVIAGYVEERRAIESIWNQQQEDNT